MRNYLIKNISIVNEGKITTADLLLKNGRIEKTGTGLQAPFAVTEINGEGKYLLPGVIDDQVHFREPGLTHKATIYTEAKAAVAGGVPGRLGQQPAGVVVADGPHGDPDMGGELADGE